MTGWRRAERPSSAVAPLARGSRGRGCRAFRLDEKGRNPRVVWKRKRLRLLMSTPLCRAGHVYALDRKDGLKRVEIQDGKVRWQGEPVPPRGHNPQARLAWAGGH